MHERTVLEQRLLENREITSGGCWNWTKSCQPYGYGQTSWPGNWRRNLRVHRVAAWLWMDFDLSSRLCVLHRCDNATCFNPDHLFIGTKRDNTADMVAKGRAANGAEKTRGQSHYNTRLTEDDVRSIRREREAGASLASIAAEHGLTVPAISMICRRVNWKHVL